MFYRKRMTIKDSLLHPWIKVWIDYTSSSTIVFVTVCYFRYIQTLN